MSAQSSKDVKAKPSNSYSFPKLFAFGLGLVALAKVVARLSNIAFHIYLLFNADQTPDPYRFAATSEGVQETCNANFKEILTIHNVNSFEEVKRIAAEKYVPILFKNFAPNVNERWAQIYEESKYENVTFSDVKIRSFGNLFLKGVEVFGEITMTLKEAVETAQDSKRAEQGKSFFASFVPFLSRNGIQIAVNSTSVSEIKLDTNFVSNFSDDVLATHIHFPSVNSFAMQLVGNKFWYFMPTNEFESYDPINTPTPWLLGGSEKMHFEKYGGISFAVTEPGDMLYFPPMSAHAVVTQKGPNVMFNLRQLSPIKAFLYNPFRIIETALAVKIQGNILHKKDIYHSN